MYLGVDSRITRISDGGGSPSRFLALPGTSPRPATRSNDGHHRLNPRRMGPRVPPRPAATVRILCVPSSSTNPMLADRQVHEDPVQVGHPRLNNNDHAPPRIRAVPRRIAVRVVLASSVIRSVPSAEHCHWFAVRCYWATEMCPSRLH